MIARPSRLQSLAAACLTLIAFADAVEARTRPVTHTVTNTICYDQNHNRIACPKKPVSKTTVIIIVVVIGVVVLAVVGFFLFKVFRRRRAQKYQSLPTPPPNAMGAHEGVMTPAAPGEMGYAGPQPQLYTAPELAYNAPSYAPPDGKPYASTYPPSDTAYAPPPGPPPPPQSAATHYGYSVGAI